MKKLFNASLLLMAAGLIFAGCDANGINEAEGPEALASHNSKKVSSTNLFAFLPAGPEGGGVLNPGDLFPPTGINKSEIVRTNNFIEYTIQTTGLPEGAYTNWIITINNPAACLTTPCTDVDVFFRQNEVGSTVFWSAGNLVTANGHGYFKARVHKNYVPSNPEQIALPGVGMADPMGAEIHLIVKYHGPASSDPDVLYDQLYTLLGSCDSGANAIDFGDPFGIQCFDPQAAIHLP